MRAILRNRTVHVVALAVAIGLAVFVVSRARSERWFRYQANQPLPAGDDNEPQDSRWRARTFTVSDGTRLRALERGSSEGSHAPVVLFFPGNSSTTLRQGQDFLDPLLDGEDWTGIAWAYRGYDGNPGNPSPRTLEEDGRRIFETLHRENPGRPIHIVAYSLGASVAGSVILQTLPVAPASVTLLASAPRIRMRSSRFAFAHDYDALERLGPRDYPVLVIHGQQDTTLGPGTGRAVAQHLAARLLEFRDKGHIDILKDPRATSAVRDLIADVSGQSQVARSPG